MLDSQQCGQNADTLAPVPCDFGQVLSCSEDRFP